MDLKVDGDQVILSGPVDGTELVKLRDVVAEYGDARIRMVVLRDSPGGDLWTSTRVGEFIRGKGWRTAISGHCFSACAIIFLGGIERQFTDDKPALQTQIAYHATYHTSDRFGATDSKNQQATYVARQWIKFHSGGKLSDEMLDRFEKLEKTEFVHFFDARRMPRAGQVSVFVCSHAEKEPARKCRPVAGTDAYQEGIVTSSAIIRSNDQGASTSTRPNESTRGSQEPER